MAVNPMMMPQIAAALAQQQQQQQQPKQAAYYGTIPNIAQARAANPMQLLANQALATGASTAPVAGGKYAWLDGIARALQGGVGALGNKKLDKQYAAREGEYMAGLKDAAAMASNPATANPAAVNPAAQAEQATAAALAGPQAAQPAPGGQTFDQAFAPLQQPQMPPPAMERVDPGASTATGPQYGPRRQAMNAPFTPATSAPARSNPVQSAGAVQLDAGTMYRSAIVPIEGGTDPKTGRFRTSPKGAIGPGQVMPGTAPEAAKLAGLPFDDFKYRNDPEYNNALGEAYFTKQLETFNDPLKAAAAYNAGPGRVNRAIRRAMQNGTDWRQYLPQETKDYVTKFETKIGVSGGGISGGSVAPSTPQAVPAPQLEQVPGGVASPGAAPSAYDTPPEVQSNRIAMAQQMLASGNPDLAVMAQAYLDQGLTEQNAARTLTSEQQMTRNRDLYGTQEADWRAGQGDVRQQAMADRTGAQERNYGRETLSRTQGFTAGENALDRDLQREISRSNQDFQLRVSSMKQANPRNPFWDTPTGLKIQTEKMDANAAIDEQLAKVRRFMQLNEAQRTGGVLGVPGVGAIASPFDDEIKEMRGLQNEITIDALGGLGIAISDGDRKFVSEAFLDVASPGKVNRNRAGMLIAVGERAKNYNLAELEFRANSSPRDIAKFQRIWKQYTQEVPLFIEDDNGDVQVNDMDFDQWLALNE